MASSLSHIVNSVFRYAFFLLLVKPLLIIFFGLNIVSKPKLPKKGPAIVIANHNSHLDTLVLMSSFDIGTLHRVRPVAAADYWLKNPIISWFACSIIGIIPIERGKTKEQIEDDKRRGIDLMDPIYDWISKDGIVLLYPEGTRSGAPEKLKQLKKGISFVVEKFPRVPVTPVMFYGLGKILPKGALIPVPFFIDAVVGDALHWTGDREDFMRSLQVAFEKLQSDGRFPEWE